MYTESIIFLLSFTRICDESLFDRQNKSAK